MWMDKRTFCIPLYHLLPFQTHGWNMLVAVSMLYKDDLWLFWPIQTSSAMAAAAMNILPRTVGKATRELWWRPFCHDAVLMVADDAKGCRINPCFQGHNKKDPESIAHKALLPPIQTPSNPLDDVISHLSGASGNLSITYFPLATLMIGTPGIFLILLFKSRSFVATM